MAELSAGIKMCFANSVTQRVLNLDVAQIDARRVVVTPCDVMRPCLPHAPFVRHASAMLRRAPRVSPRRSIARSGQPPARRTHRTCALWGPRVQRGHT